tara:strand:- start:431 stop:1696 length:1266 start_codon:yes stop_codon:yes gene_type:complete
MYNRILKRPMFKRGGSSFQAQGTGITSPFDTPRKNYKLGTTWEEINERRSAIYDPRSEMSFAAEGFSALASPYKDDGSAKTIGEMLYEGAQGVRKSRSTDKAMEQSVKLANIESDAARLMAKEKFERDKILAQISTTNPMLKDKSIPRQISEATENIIKIASQNRGNPGSEFELSGFAQGIATGLVTIANLQKGDEIVTAMVIPSSAFKKVDGNWDFDLANLSGGMVYWNPINQKWLVVENAQTANAKEIYFDTYEQAKGGLTVKKSEEEKSENIIDDSEIPEKEKKNASIKLKITTNLKDVDINDKSVIFDEAAKVGIKIVEPDGSKTWAMNLAENEMSLPAFKKILQEKKMADSYAHIKPRKRGSTFEETEEIKLTEKMAAGGRAGYYPGGSVEPDLDADELNELTSWWKSEVTNSFDS